MSRDKIAPNIKRYRRPDPKRIDRTVEELRKAWHRNPNQRLGQLISNAANVATASGDPFYVEDDEMEKRFKQY